MPQIIFEHSANLAGINYQDFFKAIYQAMVTIPNVGTCKIRSISQENYYIGAENGENAFAFLRILMAPKAERTDAFHESIAQKMLPIVHQYLAPVKKQHHIKCYPTVEVGTLSPQYYWLEQE